MKRLIYFFALVTILQCVLVNTAQSQQKKAVNIAFISATSSVNSDKAGLVIDNNPQTGWDLDAKMLKNDQNLMLALQTPGNVNALQIEAEGISKSDLQKLLSIYITYDPMNLGSPVEYTVEGDKSFKINFPQKYGAHVKLVFHGGIIKKPVSIKEVGVSYVIKTSEEISKQRTEKPWMNATLPVDKRVELLLEVMTPADKMELIREGWGIPGIPSLGIPFINKVEAIHGFSYGSGATIFPQAIALGASWDKQLAEEVAMVIGDETVSANTKQAWSPVLDVAQDARWGRVEETYGEDPVLVSEIGGAWIKGYQSNGLWTTPKHFAGHGAPLGGRDSHDIGLSEREFREIHLVPFRHVFKTYNCQSVMMNYSDFLGVPVAKSKELLNGILREEWGFNGFIVSDCGALGNMTSRKHYVAIDPVDAANQALAAGIATNCGDTYNNPAVIEAAKDGRINMENLDNVCRTMLSTMFRNGLFEDNPCKPLDWNKIYPGWNTPEHKAVARKAAREGMVLLENKDNILPLSKKAGTIAVIGPGADDLQPGDYTAKLQPGQLISVLSGIKSAVGTSSKVVYEKGCEFISTENNRIENAVALASKADVAILVLGDCSTSESSRGIQQTSGENRDYASLILPGNQQKLLEAVCATGKLVILVLQVGRPYNLTYASKHCRAILVNWLPGQEGGPATADVIFGDYNPAGRLPITFPQDVSQLPLYYNFKTSGRVYDYVDMPFYPLYSFGYGLSYTTFEYSDIKTTINDDGTLDVEASVKNKGKLAGDEVVQLYITDTYSSVKTRVMELKDFTRIHLAAGESKIVKFRLTPYQLSLLNETMDRVVESGQFKIMIGGKSPSFVAGDKIKDSVGFKNPSEGVNKEIDYPYDFVAEFEINYTGIGMDRLNRHKVARVIVKNNGNITDADKITMYANGAKTDDVHHFELDPGQEKEIEFIIDNNNYDELTFTTKYSSNTQVIKN